MALTLPLSRLFARTMPTTLPARPHPLFALTFSLALNLACAAAAHAHEVDFVVDGSFEQPTSASGWQGAAPRLQAAGAASIPATPYGQTVAALRPAARLQQRLPLPAGTYTLTWADAGPRAGAGQPDADFGYRISYAGAALAQGSVRPGRRWLRHAVSFHADGAGLLRFEATGMPAAGQPVGAAAPQALIDAVGVTADRVLPVPGSYTMLMVGLGLLASVAQGRARARAPFKH